MDIPTTGMLNLLDIGNVAAALSSFKRTWTARGFPMPNHEFLRGLERVGSIICHPDVLARHDKLSACIAKANRRLSKLQSKQSVKRWLLHFARRTVGVPMDLAGAEAAMYEYRSSMDEEAERELVIWQVRWKVAHVHSHCFELGIWSILGTES
jgi:hypothetical protein